MRQFLKRLFCLHLSWREIGPHPVPGITTWECRDCGKHRLFKTAYPPVSLNP